MSRPEAQALWLRLRAAGLVAGERPPPGMPASPWFVRVMLGVAGWIGAVFLLIFVGLGLKFVMNSPAAMFASGLIACAAAGALFHARPDSDFATQFGLASSLAGQGLVLGALAKGLHGDTSAIALSMGLFQAVLFFAVPNFVHRVWTAWTGAYAIVYAVAVWRLQAYVPVLLSAACAWIWLNEFRYAQRGPMLRAGGYGLVLALMAAVNTQAMMADAWLSTAGIGRPPEDGYHLWIGAGMSGVVLLWTVWRLLLREGVQPASGAGWRILVAAGVLVIATLKAPGLAPATLILLLGFGNGNRVLAGLGVAALLGYLSFYYYSLEATLLHKSALMAVTGAALLAARFVLQQAWPAPLHRGDRHA